MGNLVFWGGGLGGAKWFLGRAGGFFGSESVVFFLQLFSIGPLNKFWGVAMSDFDFTHLSIHANINDYDNDNARLPQGWRQPAGEE